MPTRARLELALAVAVGLNLALTVVLLSALVALVFRVPVCAPWPVP